METKEFKVNDHISLKLEFGKTKIYLDGRLFRACKYLLLNKLHLNEIGDFIGNFKSIDEEAAVLDHPLEQNSYQEDLTPESEFWAHCSNLQVWTENDYDSRLLHRSLAFPLLEGLAKTGEAKAKIILKEEIFKRFESGAQNVISYLLENNYNKYLTKEEFFESILINEEAKALKRLEEFTNLEYVLVRDMDIIDNDYHQYEHFVVQNKNITELTIHLGTNSLTFPNLLGKFKKLHTIRLFFNELVKIIPNPKVVLSSVKKLKLVVHGQETIITDMFDKFPNLRELEIYNGEFETIPKTLGSLSYLKTLRINRNILNGLPKSIGSLNDLERIDLTNSYLANYYLPSLPETIARLKKLKWLKINTVLIDENINNKTLNMTMEKSGQGYVIFKKEVK